MRFHNFPQFAMIWRSDLAGTGSGLTFNLGFGLLVVDGLLYLAGYMRDEGVAPSKYNPQADAQAVGV